MSDSEARPVRPRRGTHDEVLERGSHRAPWTPAQWYCLAAGLALLLAGVFGFISDSTFDVGGALNGDGFLGFEVNGWHNVVHVLSGVLLLAAFRRRGPARTVALAFGVVYGIVAIIGLIDGNDVVGLIPVNAADNVLHIALSALGIATGLVSRGSYDRDRVLAGEPRADDRELGGRVTRGTSDDEVAQRQQRLRH
jgi:Domain of unknown function (DUF4383)